MLFDFVDVIFGDGNKCYNHRYSGDYFIHGFAMNLRIYFMILIANPKLSVILREQSCVRFCHTFGHFDGSIAWSVRYSCLKLGYERNSLSLWIGGLAMDSQWICRSILWFLFTSFLRCTCNAGNLLRQKSNDTWEVLWWGEGFPSRPECVCLPLVEAAPRWSESIFLFEFSFLVVFVFSYLYLCLCLYLYFSLYSYLCFYLYSIFILYLYFYLYFYFYLYL